MLQAAAFSRIQYLYVVKQKIQAKLQKAVNEQLAGFTEKTKGVYAMQGAATCINNKNGKALPLWVDESRNLPRAIRSTAVSRVIASREAVLSRSQYIRRHWSTATPPTALWMTRILRMDREMQMAVILARFHCAQR